jgi:predicted nucleotidyltransferase
MNFAVMNQNEILRLLKIEVLNAEPQAKIILFGSRARGSAREDSDWDLLILVDKKLTHEIEDKILDAIYDFSLKADELFTPFIYSQSDWDKYRLLPFYKNVESEGIFL